MGSDTGDGASDSSAGGDVATDIGMEGYPALLEQLGRMRDENRLSHKSGDPYDLMQQARALRESEYSGATGFLRRLVHEGDADRADQDFESAEQAQRKADMGQAYADIQVQNEKEMTSALRQTDRARVLSQIPAGPSWDAVISQYSYQDAIEEADKLGQRSYSEYGAEFKNEGELEQAIARLKSNAGAVRDEEHTREVNEENFAKSQDEGRLKSLQLREGGDVTGAERQDIINQLDAEGQDVPAGDQAAGARFKRIRSQTLSNFDADTARRKKFEAAQSDDQIREYQEEGSEAQLRGEGKDWEAKNAALKFSTEQRVRTLREAADAEADITRKQQLNREADAADQAGKIEVQAQLQEHQRQLAEARKAQRQPQPTPQNQEPEPAAQNNQSAGSEEHCEGSLERRSRQDHGDLSGLEPTYFSDAASIRQEYERRNIQAANMARLADTSSLGDSLPAALRQIGGDRPQISGRFEDLISKLEKHFARGLTLAMVRD